MPVRQNLHTVSAVCERHDYPERGPFFGANWECCLWENICLSHMAIERGTVRQMGRKLVLRHRGLSHPFQVSFAATSSDNFDPEIATDDEARPKVAMGADVDCH